MVGILSDIGTTRKNNEDSIGYYENENLKFYVIADGMGGHNAGEIASRIAVDTTIDYFKNLTCEKDISNLLVEAISIANEKIFNLAQEDEKLAGMGTTLTACIIMDEKIAVANIGDSRCYAIDETGIFKVTKDHSYVQQLIDNGSITEDEAINHPNKNIITRSLGTSYTVEVDIFLLDIYNIYKVILCTDGLTDEVTEKEIYDIILENDNQSACYKLIELSKRKGGRDNISVIIFEGECKNDRNFARK